MANITPSGTAMRVVITARITVCVSAERIDGSLSTDPSGSQVYQRRENPCHVLRDRPALKEKMMVMSTGTRAQSR